MGGAIAVVCQRHAAPGPQTSSQARPGRLPVARKSFYFCRVCPESAQRGLPAGMCDPRALFVVGALVVVGVVLAVVLTEHHGDGGGGPPPQYTGAPAVLLESFSWKPLLSPPSQPLLFWAIDGATAAYDPGSSQCWTLADGGSRWTLVPATGQQPQLGDSLYTNSVGSTGGVYVVASSGAVWLTLDCQEWSKVARGVPLTSPRAAAKLFSLPDPYTAAPLTLVYAGGRTAGACDAKAFASDNGEHWTTFKLPELPRGCLPAFSTSGGDGTVLYFGASSVWEASGALAGGHVAWTRSCYLSGTVNEVVFGPLILPTHLFPSPTDSGINASLLNATLGSSSTDAWVSVFTVDDGIAQPSTAYSYSTDSCAWSTPRSNPPWTAKYGGGTARAVSVGAGRYALCGGYAASGRSKQLPECWLSTPVYVEHTDDPSIPTVTHRPTQSHSSTSSSTPTPSNTPTPTDSITPSNSQSSTPSITPSPSNSPTLPPSPSPTPSNTPSPSNSPTLPPSPSPTPSHSPTRSDSPTPRPPPPPAPSRASAAAAGPIAGAVCGSALAALAGALLYRRCRGRQEAVGAFYSGHGSGSGGARLNESLLGEVFGGEAGGLAMPRPTAPPQQPRSNAAAAHGTFEASAFSPPLPLHLPSARTPQPYAQPSVFECPVDLNDFVDPVTAPCGHTLCRGCYIGLFAHGCSACPTCRSPLPRQPPAINIIIRDAQAAAAQRRTTPTLAHIDEANLIVDETPAGLLGEGGFGVVRRGLWNNAPVAVKSLKRDAADAGEAPARAFNREMQVLAQLKHPNVVPVSC